MAIPPPQDDLGAQDQRSKPPRGWQQGKGEGMESIEFRALKELAEKYERALIVLANMNASCGITPLGLPNDPGVAWRMGYEAAIQKMRKEKREAEYKREAE